MDAPSGMALLARRPAVLLKNAVDESHDDLQLRARPLWIVVSRRHRARDGLTDHPAMNAELAGDARDGADTEFMLPAELLEEFQFRDPIHSRLPGLTRATLGCGAGVGQIRHHKWANIR